MEAERGEEAAEKYLSIDSGFPGGSVVKNLPANAGDTRSTGSIPGLGRSLEYEMATYSSILDWEIPWTEEPGGLQFMGSESHLHKLKMKSEAASVDVEAATSYPEDLTKVIN